MIVFLSSELRAASEKSKNGANCRKNGGEIRAERGKRDLFVLRLGFGLGALPSRAPSICCDS